MNQMMQTTRRALSWTALASMALATAVAGGSAKATGPGSSYLEHTSSFFLQQNVRPGEEAEPTAAEIIAFSGSKKQLVYTDGFSRRLGIVDTFDVANPQADGWVDLPGDPTSVAIVGNHALVSIATSMDPDGSGPLNEFDAPSGELLVIQLATRSIERILPLAGQPDAIAVAPSGRYAAIAIENERDEDENDGIIPQAPAGLLQILDVSGDVEDWSLTDVDLTGLAGTAPSDPEPEFVDINAADKAVVTLQENNHLVIVDLSTATVETHFSAGTVDLFDIDTVEEELGPQENGLIVLDGTLLGRRREPDAVKWVDEDTFAIANEGDYEDAGGLEGGSRGFTLFNVDGTVEFEAGNSFEHLVIAHGHYPEGRSENKGSEPEGLEVGHDRGQTYLFVASERGNVVGVYRMEGETPVFVQMLPTGIGPEGLVFQQGTLAVSSEVDGFDDGFAARPFITFWEFEKLDVPTYPYLVSETVGGVPIPWVAQSGLSGDPVDDDVMWSVSDSFLAQAALYKIDVSSHPARIVERIEIGEIETDDPAQLDGEYDLEGVAARPEGGFWLASEGRVSSGSSRPNLVVRTNAAGTVLFAVELPATLTAGATNSGFEGVAVTGTTAGGDETVYVVIQREWDDDAPGEVKIGRYDVAGESWTFATYVKDPVESPAGGWVGLSEITALPDGRLAIIERDNQLGLEARIKRVYGVDPSSVAFAPHGSPLPVIQKTLLRDILGDLDSASISVPDKVEGLGVTRDGRVFLSTDNDGVDENYGETLMIELGDVADVF
jgi:hypothetical protein